MKAVRRIGGLLVRVLALAADGRYRRDTLRLIAGRGKDRRLRADILEYLGAEDDPGTREVRSFIETHGDIVFPYAFPQAYSPDDVEVFRDGEHKGMMYVMHNGRRMYVKRSFRFKFQVRSWYNSLRVEQDPESPHRYLLEGRRPPEGCVVADLGGAEGMFTLDVLDCAGKVYVFEGDPGWREALELTFAPYKDKVEIVSKYVGDRSEGGMVRLDDFFRDRELDYIKADIEGWEERMLEGASEVLGTKVSRVLCCVYHRKDSEARISEFLRGRGFSVSVNKNRMIFIYSEQVAGEPLRPPYLRHGVLYAERPGP